MAILITNIKGLVHTEQVSKERYCGKEMSDLQCIEDAFLFLKDGRIHSFGRMDDKSLQALNGDQEIERINASGCFVFPSWCDSHTHIVYAQGRENEFAERIKGLSYEEIASRGGGILNSAAKLKKTTEDDLYESARVRMKEIMRLGTGAVEIKSGYGLDLESELKMLRVIRRLKENSQMLVKATFLGAHALPSEFKNNSSGYLRHIIDEMLPAIAEEGLAEFCDVFCEKNYFSKEDAVQLLNAAKKSGLTPKVHAEQLSHSGGIEAGIKTGAISVDHLEYANENDIELLLKSRTMPVLLPGAQFFLDLPRPPARKMIDKGLPVAISSDFNPGSCPSGNMNQMISLACILYRLTPEEAIIAATTNSAYAMNTESEVGSIAVGKRANVFITKPMNAIAALPYHFGSNLVDKVILNGKVVSNESF